MIILIIIVLFTISELMVKFKPFIKNKEDQNTYYYLKEKFLFFHKYSGIYFESLKYEIVLFRIQTGLGGDRCITICNISIIIGDGL